VKASGFAEMVTVDSGERFLAVLEVFRYCLVCTSEYAEARVEGCVVVFSFFSTRVGIGLYLNDSTARPPGLAKSGSNSSPERFKRRCRFWSWLAEEVVLVMGTTGSRIRGGTCNPCLQQVVAVVAARSDVTRGVRRMSRGPCRNQDQQCQTAEDA
jgi:hypothetical protein